MDKKVILISIDGMRPDGFLQCGHPFTGRMMERFSYSLDGMSMEPSVTLPCHTSIFYGVPPARHGITTNTYTPPVRPINGIAEQLANAGKVSAAFYNWEQMRHVWRSGAMKYSMFVDNRSEESSDLMLTEEALKLIERREPDFVYLYLVDTDECGHDYGWMTDSYLQTLNKAVGCVEKVFSACADRYDIIVTADHGGHGRDHGSTCPEDMTIPIFFYGNQFEGGKVLHGISLLDIAPTIAWLMGVAASREWEGNIIQ